MKNLNTDQRRAAFGRNHNKTFNHKGHKGYEGRAKKFVAARYKPDC